MSEEVKSQIKEIAYRLAFGKDEWNDFEESLNKIFSQEHQSHEKTKELSKKSVVSGYKKDSQEIIRELEALEDVVACMPIAFHDNGSCSVYLRQLDSDKTKPILKAFQNAIERKKKWIEKPL